MGEKTISIWKKKLDWIVEKGGMALLITHPDYMKDEINEMEDNIKTVEMPSHKNVPLNPIKRAEMRYNILEKELCMKP
jgi:hypothetical protein